MQLWRWASWGCWSQSQQSQVGGSGVSPWVSHHPFVLERQINILTHITGDLHFQSDSLCDVRQGCLKRTNTGIHSVTYRRIRSDSTLNDSQRCQAKGRTQVKPISILQFNRIQGIKTIELLHLNHCQVWIHNNSNNSNTLEHCTF